MLHYRVMFLMFRAAWREKVLDPPGGPPHVRELHTFRDRAWWDCWKMQPFLERKGGGLTHDRAGKVAEWEDALVEALGLEWRGFRDQFENYKEWVTNFNWFANQLSERWGLPRHPGLH